MITGSQIQLISKLSRVETRKTSERNALIQLECDRKEKFMAMSETVWELIKGCIQMELESLKGASRA